MIEEIGRTRIIHFATIDISQLLRTSGFNVKLENSILRDFVIFFLNFQSRTVTSNGTG